LEEQMLVAAHKFGIIYAKENQITENELFSNRESHLFSVLGSSACTQTEQSTLEETDEPFEAFLRLLGTKIDLQSWEGYSGGLDTGSTLQPSTCIAFS